MWEKLKYFVLSALALLLLLFGYERKKKLDAEAKAQDIESDKQQAVLAERESNLKAGIENDKNNLPEKPSKAEDLDKGQVEDFWKKH